MIGALAEIGELGWWLGGLGAVSALTFVLSLVLVPTIVVRLPADHFERVLCGEPAAPQPLTIRVGRVALGSLLLVAGTAMLVLPGQGLLTIALGLLVLEGPWKRRFVGWLVRHERLMRALDWLRTRAGKPAFVRPGCSPAPEVL